MARVSIRA
jgi:hypothetical protein